MKTLGITAVLLTLSLLVQQAFAQSNSVTPRVLPTNNGQVSRLQSGSQAQAFDKLMRLYGTISQRSVLLHPATPRHGVSVAELEKSNWLAAFESELSKQGIAVLPLGTSFTVIAPVSITNELSKLSSPAAGSSAVLPKGTVDFINAPLPMVLNVYAELAGKTLKERPAGPTPSITFVSSNPLSREEVLFALETLLSWHGIRIVAEGEKDISAAFSAAAKPKPGGNIQQ